MAAKFFRDLADIFDGKGQAAGKYTVLHGSFKQVAAKNAPRKLIRNRLSCSGAAKAPLTANGHLTDYSADSKGRSNSTGASHKTSSKEKKDDGAAEPKETKKKKKEKNDNGIKKPLSAFMLFTNHRRPIVREEYPGKCKSRLTTFAADLKLVELSKIIGAEWGKLSDTQKQPWTEKASDL